MAPVVALRAASSSSVKPQPTAQNNGLKACTRIGGVLAGQTLGVKLALADTADVVLTPPSVPMPTGAESAVDSGILDVIADNPVIVGGIAALLAVPVGINAISRLDLKVRED